MEKVKTNFEEKEIKHIFDDDKLIEKYAYGLIHVLTDIEQGILSFLVELKQALTKGRIRSFFIESYILFIHDVYESSKKRKSSEDILERISWRPSISINLKTNSEIIDEFLKLYGDRKLTETERIVSLKNILSKYKIQVPSFDVIDVSLRSLKRMGFIGFRIQNKRELWYINPKFNEVLKKIYSKKSSE